MRFFELLEKKNITAYQLAKDTGIPYTTISDLIHFKTQPKNISLDHALKISDYLGIDIKELASMDCAPLTDLEFFRNQIIMYIKLNGPTRFISKVIKNKEIDFYFKNDGLAHALFLLATIDYLSRKNHLSIYQKRYNDLRKLTLEKPLFTTDDIISFSSLEEAEHTLGLKIVDEYRRFNIVEIEIPHLF